MVKTLAALLAGGYASLVALGRVGYRSVLYPAPRRGVGATPAGSRLERWQASDGEPLEVLVHPASGAAPAATLVLFHGNGETVADSIGPCLALAAAGLQVVAVEYRGYGSSPAKNPSEEGLYADAEGALATLRRQGFAAADTTLWGSSLGTGVAVEMALRGHAARLVLQAPYTSIPAVAARLLPWLPMDWMVGDRFDNASKVERLGQVPTLILHGDADAVVPYDMGEEIARLLPGATLMTVSGGGHNDLFALEPARLLKAIAGHARGEPVSE
jgi:pimeloyl-ACP methyl ester carboxylesterase